MNVFTKLWRKLFPSRHSSWRHDTNLTEAIQQAFDSPGFRDKLTANIVKNNALLDRMMKMEPLPIQFEQVSPSEMVTRAARAWYENPTDSTELALEAELIANQYMNEEEAFVIVCPSLERTAVICVFDSGIEIHIPLK